MLSGKNIVVGVAGGIGCYKMCDVVSRLKKLNANVDVIMTRSATEFVAPLTFETLSKNKVVVEMFDGGFHAEVEHIALAKKAALFLIAPTTANVIGKLANGIADDMLTSTVLATRAPLLLVPSMNTNMLENSAVQANLETLTARGYRVFEPVEGLLACGDTGKGKLPEPADIVAEACRCLYAKRDFEGKRVLVTAGGTAEPVDGVRYLANRSSGKMGVELARAFLQRGAEVVLICGRMEVLPPRGAEVVNVNTTTEMYDAVMRRFEDCDCVVKAAAPADYRPKVAAAQKHKGDSWTLELVKNPDIAAAVGARKGARKLVAFCAETENLLENAQKKLAAKRADLIVANDVTKEGAGFGADTNIVSILDRDGNVCELECMAKSALSHVILDKIAELG